MNTEHELKEHARRSRDEVTKFVFVLAKELESRAGIIQW